MSTAPKRILCYGDSNTWGYVPSSEDPDLRFPVTVRWTGLLQTRLGPDFALLEEGLNSRTTDLDDPDLVGKNGLTGLPSILERAGKLDAALVLLGTNDLKAKYERNAEQITQGLERVVKGILGNAPIPLLIMAPPIPKTERVYETFQYPGLHEKAKQLGAPYKALAQKYGAAFLDLAPLITSSDKDGVHWDESEHFRLAETLAPLVRALYRLGA